MAAQITSHATTAYCATQSLTDGLPFEPRARGPFALSGTDTALTSHTHPPHSPSLPHTDLSSLETGSSFHLKQEDITDFEYGGSVATRAGGLSKGFLKKGEKLGEVAEGEEDGDDEPAIEEVLDEEAEAVKLAEKAAALERKEAEEMRAAETRSKVVAAKMAKLPKFTLKILGGDWLDVQRKPRHQKAFDVCVIGTTMAFVMGSERLNGLLKPRASILLETAKFMVEVRKENRKEYLNKLLGVASRIGWELKDGTNAPDGCKDALVRYTYDEETWEGLAELAKAKLEKERKGASTEAVPSLTGEGEGEEGEGDGEKKKKGDGSPVDVSDINMLQITDGASAAQEEPVESTYRQAKKHELGTAVEVKLTPGSEPAAVSTGGKDSKLCAITGKPAKYRDPISGLPYADLAAFKELRKLHPDPKAAEKEKAKEEAAKAAEEMKAKKEGTATAEEKSGEGADGEEVKEGEMETIVAGGRRDIMVGEDFRRRVNKIC